MCADTLPPSAACDDDDVMMIIWDDAVALFAHAVNVDDNYGVCFLSVVVAMMTTYFDDDDDAMFDKIIKHEQKTIMTDTQAYTPHRKRCGGGNTHIRAMNV